MTVTKTKIKNLLNPGGNMSKGELIEAIQFFTDQYNNGYENTKYIIIGLFIATGLNRFKATKAFFKIQELHNFSSDPKCPVCGDVWDGDECVNCGNDLPF